MTHDSNTELTWIIFAVLYIEQLLLLSASLWVTWPPDKITGGKISPAFATDSLPIDLRWCPIWRIVCNYFTRIDLWDRNILEEKLMNGRILLCSVTTRYSSITFDVAAKLTGEYEKRRYLGWDSVRDLMSSRDHVNNVKVCVPFAIPIQNINWLILCLEEKAETIKHDQTYLNISHQSILYSATSHTLSTMSKPTSIYSLTVKDTASSSASSINSQRPSTISNLKERLHHIQKTWGPLMAAKAHLDDEYNFPPGRYAGQGYRRADGLWWAFMFPRKAERRICWLTLDVPVQKSKSSWLRAIPARNNCPSSQMM